MHLLTDTNATINLETEHSSEIQRIQNKKKLIQIRNKSIYTNTN